MGNRSTRHVYSAGLDAADVADWYGVPITTVPRTLADEARHSRRGGVIAIDAALREKLVTVEHLHTAVESAAGWPGVRRAREVVALADGRAESPLESITRLALHDSGFPPPMLQVTIGPFRVDFYWPEFRLVLEADGEGKYVGEAGLREKRREHYLHKRGLRVERVMWRDVYADWTQTARRLESAMRAA
jgi:very-short-patch-repair endonuclease